MGKMAGPGPGQDPVIADPGSAVVAEPGWLALLAAMVIVIVVTRLDWLTNNGERGRSTMDDGRTAQGGWRHLWWTLPIATVLALPPWVLAAFAWGCFGGWSIGPAVAGVVITASLYFGAVTMPTKLTLRVGVLGALVGLAGATIGALIILSITL